jgi:uncharacterized protein (TIGR02996 family)
MTDESTFLAMLAEHPNDDETRLVYADWLEGRGDAVRARVLRGIVALGRMPLDTGDAYDAALPVARRLLRASKALVAEWLERVSHPRVDGTVWGLRDGGRREYVIGFLPDGKLHYRRSDDQTLGTWGQVGAAVWFAINDYSYHEGVFGPDRIIGDAANDMRMTWRVDGIRLAPETLHAPEMPELPEALADSPYVNNTALPKDSPRPRARIAAQGAVWWVRKPSRWRIRAQPKRKKKTAKPATAKQVRAKAKATELEPAKAKAKAKPGAKKPARR